MSAALRKLSTYANQKGPIVNLNLTCTVQAVAAAIGLMLLAIVSEANAYGYLGESITPIETTSTHGESNGRISFSLDNDFFPQTFFSDTDRYFTNGLQSHARFTSLGTSFISHLEDKLYGTKAIDDKIYWGLFAGHNMYTPSELRSERVCGPDEVASPGVCLDPGERPYAGMLYFGVSHDVLWNEGDKVRRVSAALTLGCTGDCAQASLLQKHWHALRRESGADQTSDDADPSTPSEETDLNWLEKGVQIEEAQLINVMAAFETDFLRGNRCNASGRILGNLGQAFTNIGLGATARHGALRTSDLPARGKSHF